MSLFLSHPTTVTFPGLTGGVISVSFSAGSAGVQDVTSFASAASEGRVIRDYVSTSIDSGTASIRLIGSVGFTRSDLGKTGTLSITTPAGSFSSEAILTAWDVEASVGDLIKGSANFTLIG